jgi:hypothetical protein
MFATSTFSLSFFLLDFHAKSYFQILHVAKFAMQFFGGIVKFDKNLAM